MMVDGLAAASVGISTVNIVGGFMVTQKMLDLFKRPGDEDHSMMIGAPLTGLVVAAPIINPALIEPTNTVCGLLCIGAIGGLSTMPTANTGAKLGMAGVAGATTTTMLGETYLLLIV